MIAAIYARKSTEQAGVSDEEKSVARQITHARDYAVRKGWTVAEAHVYVDDGISGAEFERRPGFLRLMNALKPRPPFQVLVMSEESRLGREQFETAYTLKQIVQAGVRVVYYLEDRERTLDSPMEKFLLSVTAFADEQEREKARQRTHDAMRRKALNGHVTGGVVFGYNNVEVTDPSSGRRQHVIRQINEAEATVVRRIFELYAAGHGVTAIAKRLNEEGAPTPRPRKGPVRGWERSSVWALLRRPLYRGEIAWNRSKKRDTWGHKRQRPRPREEWVTKHDPSLRTIDEGLWQTVQNRLQNNKQAYLARNDGQAHGRPPGNVESKYLLTGLATCAACGGSLCVRSQSRGRGRRGHRYVCTAHHLRGGKVCGNGLTIALQDADVTVLRMLKRDLLHPAVIEAVLRKAQRLIAPDAQDRDGRRRELQERLTRLDAELGRLTAAIAQGADVASVVEAIKAREQERAEIRQALTALDAVPRVVPIEPRMIRETLRTRLADWLGVLSRQPAEARQALLPLLKGRLLFTPKEDESGRYYEITGVGTVTPLLAGVVDTKGLVSPTGFEPVFPD